MNEKEMLILQEIINYYNDNKLMPTVRYLKEKMHFESTSSIHYYLNKLEKKEYLIKNNSGKRILNNNYNEFEKGLKIIKTINANESIKIYLDTNKDYYAFKMNNDNLINEGIIKGDLLIILKTKKLKNNDIGLFKINKKYYIMKYFYKDNIYILESDIKRYYDHVNIIGKVIYLERKIKRDYCPF